MAEFLNDRNYTVRVGSGETMLQSRVPQGSVLGPRLFTEYAEDVSLIFDRRNLHHHLFADDMRAIAVADHMMLMRW